VNETKDLIVCKDKKEFTASAFVNPAGNGANMQESQAKFWATTKPHTMVMPTRLDSGTSADMELNARNFIQSGAQNLVLDCAALTYMTSAGMHAILAIAKLMQNVQGKLSISNLQGQPQDIFKTCSFEQIISLQDETGASVIGLAA
jgi:anti-sigma B factor antagonist